jgi:hypothetical protein
MVRGLTGLRADDAVDAQQQLRLLRQQPGIGNLPKT